MAFEDLKYKWSIIKVYLKFTSHIVISEWQTTARTSLVSVTSTCEEYKDTLISVINAITKHSFLAKCQAIFLEPRKNPVPCAKWNPSYHWGKEYFTLHLLVVYFIDGDGNIQQSRPFSR